MAHSADNAPSQSQSQSTHSHSHSHPHPHSQSPAPGLTTTCHPPDECAICTIYADHFDISSLLSRLSSTSINDADDAYTQGLHQGLALQAQETDTQISRYRSRLASSHLKVQQIQSESEARQHAIHELQEHATRAALEIEELKRELGVERDRSVALEMECDELQVELADERRRDYGGGPGGLRVESRVVSANANANANVNANANADVYYDGDGDWIWDWDDDWDKDDVDQNVSSDDADADAEQHSTNLSISTVTSSSSISAASTSTSTTPLGLHTTGTGQQRSQPLVSPTSPDEDWGWVYDVSFSSSVSSSVESGAGTGASGYAERNIGVYWEDYQDDTIFDELGQKGKKKTDDSSSAREESASPPPSTYISTSTSVVHDQAHTAAAAAALNRARARLHEHTHTSTGYLPEWNWDEKIRDVAVQLPLAIAISDFAGNVNEKGTNDEDEDEDEDEEEKGDRKEKGKAKGKGKKTSRSTRSNLEYSSSSTGYESSRTSGISSGSGSGSESDSSTSTSKNDVDLNPTIPQIVALISLASSTPTLPTSPTSPPSPTSPTASTSAPSQALALIRALIQHAERTPKKARSDAQVWLLANWRRPSPAHSPRAPDSQRVSVTKAKAPYHPVLTLPSTPEIHVDASSTGVGFYFPLPLLPPTSTSTSTATATFSNPNPNPAQWLAYRWAPGGHPAIPLGSSGKIVISWAELVAVEMGVYILRAMGYGCGGCGGCGESSKAKANGNGKVNERTRVIVRSDNMGVVKALLSLSRLPLSTAWDPNFSKKVNGAGNGSNTNPWTITHGLNTIVHRILRACEMYNMELDVRWVRSQENLADGPSRAAWSGVWSRSSALFGRDVKMEMMDWDLLQTPLSGSSTREMIERVPGHLKEILVPVGVGVNLN